LNRNAIAVLKDGTSRITLARIFATLSVSCTQVDRCLNSAVLLVALRLRKSRDFDLLQSVALISSLRSATPSNDSEQLSYFWFTCQTVELNNGNSVHLLSQLDNHVVVVRVFAAITVSGMWVRRRNFTRNAAACQKIASNTNIVTSPLAVSSRENKLGVDERASWKIHQRTAEFQQIVMAVLRQSCYELTATVSVIHHECKLSGACVGSSYNATLKLVLSFLFRIGQFLGLGAWDGILEACLTSLYDFVLGIDREMMAV
jgi:hypothetical protein